MSDLQVFATIARVDPALWEEDRAAAEIGLKTHWLRRLNDEGGNPHLDDHVNITPADQIDTRDFDFMEGVTDDWIYVRVEGLAHRPGEGG